MNENPSTHPRVCTRRRKSLDTRCLSLVSSDFLLHPVHQSSENFLRLRLTHPRWTRTPVIEPDVVRILQKLLYFVSCYPISVISHTGPTSHDTNSGKLRFSSEQAPKPIVILDVCILHNSYVLVSCSIGKFR